MSTNETRTQERTELDDRDRRALEQYLTVLEDYDRARGADGLYMVVSQSGSEYLVDAREESCECPDFEYRGIRCKHLRRVLILRGDRPVSAAAFDELDVNEHLGEHIEASPTIVAADGSGVVEPDDTTVREAVEGVEVLEDDDADPWKGPFTEFDKYGEPTGEHYYRCRDCGREVLDDVGRDRVSHREGCQFGDGEDDGRDEPTRHEPADFGGGDSTGVQSL